MTALAAVSIRPEPSFAERLPAPKVILLRPPAAPAAVSEALVRLQAELTVEGFDAQVADFDLGADVRASLEKVAPTMAATAVVAVVAGSRSGERRAVGRRSHDRQDRRPARARRPEGDRAHRRGAVDPRPSSCCARASSSWRSPRGPRPTSSTCRCRPTPVVTRFVTEPLVEAEPDWTWAVEAGAGGMGALQERAGGTTLLGEILPVARVQRAFNARFCARVSFAGLGTQAQVDLPGGYANVVADQRARRRAAAVPPRAGGWSRSCRSARASST